MRSELFNDAAFSLVFMQMSVAQIFSERKHKMENFDKRRKKATLNASGERNSSTLDLQ